MISSFFILLNNLKQNSIERKMSLFIYDIINTYS